MKNKADFLCDYIIENRLDFAALTETWLGKDNQDSAAIASLVPDGYKVLHVPSLGGRGWWGCTDQL